MLNAFDTTICSVVRVGQLITNQNFEELGFLNRQLHCKSGTQSLYITLHRKCVGLLYVELHNCHE